MNSCVVNKFRNVLFLLLAASFTACMEPEPIYEVEPILVEVQGGQKKAVKTDRQFVSGAFADVMKKQITTSELDEAIYCYDANSDKEMIRDMIIRDLLKRTAAVIPSVSEMRNDPEKFVGDTYRRFYKRDPSDLERWTVQNQIEQDTSIHPVMVYYVFMSAEEYSYF
jgi:hypothetical protein